MSDFPTPNDPFKPPQSGMKTNFGPKIIPSKLSTPAIVLMVIACLNIVYAVASPFVQPMIQETMQEAIVNVMPDEKSKEEIRKAFEEQKNSPMSSPIALWGIAAVSLIISGCMLFGALQMKSAGSYGWALAAAIIAMIPCGDCCCCIELPIGIWALMVIVKPEIKQLFGG